MSIPSLAAAGRPAVDECLHAADSGQALRDEGRYLAARNALFVCADEACPAVVRRDCMRWSAELEQSIPTVVFAIRDERGMDVADVSVSVDGQPLVGRLDGRPIPVDPGTRAFRFDAGSRHVEQRFLINSAEKNRLLTVRLEGAASVEEPPPLASASTSAGRVPVLPIALGGFGVAAFGLGAYLGLSARGDLGSLESSPCAATKTCATSEVDSIRSRLIVADVFLGLGVLSLGAAAWTWFARGPAHRAGAVSFDVNPAPGGARVRLEGRF